MDCGVQRTKMIACNELEGTGVYERGLQMNRGTNGKREQATGQYDEGWRKQIVSMLKIVGMGFSEAINTGLTLFPLTSMEKTPI